MGHTIGILDSGVGGLAILREIHKRLPNQDLIYVADQAHLPYGSRPLTEIQTYTEAITRYLLAQGAAVIVIACNTASAAALHEMRERFPHVPFVGLEPAVRPATRDTRKGAIGVIATEATFQGKLYASVIQRFAEGITVIKRACPELVTLAERGAPWTKSDSALVNSILADFQAANIDQLVLGCTHFTFVEPLLRSALGEEVAIIDPAPAVARQVERVLSYLPQTNHRRSPGTIHFYSTSDPARFRTQIQALLGEAAGRVDALSWQNDTHLIPHS